MDRKSFAQYLDLANHHADATEAEIREVCGKVKQYGFHTAFVNSCYVPLAKGEMEKGGEKGERGKVGTVISFPLGQDAKDLKISAAAFAVRAGADELDVSMNVGQFKFGEDDKCLEEMKAIVTAAKEIKTTTVVKFIIETGLLTDEEIKKASLLVLQSGADFVKTCSGYGPRGATLKDVELIKSVVGDKIKIKVAGGISDYQNAQAFIATGAIRIGTSKAVEIIEEMPL